MSFAVDPAWLSDPEILGDNAHFADIELEPNRLDNDIHPIWAHRNWTRRIRLEQFPKCIYDPALITEHHCRPLPKASYERLEPALRLASLFLEKSLPWFWSSAFAPFDTFKTPSKLVFQDPIRTVLRHDSQPWTPEREDQIRKALEVMAPNSFFVHGLKSSEMDGIIACAVRCTRELDLDLPDNPGEDDDTVRREYRAEFITAINESCIQFIDSDDWPLVPLAGQKRFLFLLAITLMHELSHHVSDYRPDHNVNEEPCFHPEEVEPELGYSWENYMFGNHLDSCDSSVVPERSTDEYRPHWPHKYLMHSLYMNIMELKLRPGNARLVMSHAWMMESENIERFFDKRIWTVWLAMPIVHGEMPPGPLQLHLTPRRMLFDNTQKYNEKFNEVLELAANMDWSREVDLFSSYGPLRDPSPEPVEDV